MLESTFSVEHSKAPVLGSCKEVLRSSFTGRAILTSPSSRQSLGDRRLRVANQQGIPAPPSKTSTQNAGYFDTLDPAVTSERYLYMNNCNNGLRRDTALRYEPGSRQKNTTSSVWLSPATFRPNNTFGSSFANSSIGTTAGAVQGGSSCPSLVSANTHQQLQQQSLSTSKSNFLKVVDETTGQHLPNIVSNGKQGGNASSNHSASGGSRCGNSSSASSRTTSSSRAQHNLRATELAMSNAPQMRSALLETQLFVSRALREANNSS